jgi:outer membrane protein assembly factor BamB
MKKKKIIDFLIGALLIASVFSVPSALRAASSDENNNIKSIGSCVTTYPASDVATQASYAYVISAGPTSGALDVIDAASSPARIIGSCTDFTKPLDVVVHGAYAYILDASSSSKYYVKQVSISTPSNPSIVKTKTYNVVADSQARISLKGDVLYVYAMKSLQSSVLDIYTLPSFSLEKSYPVSLIPQAFVMFNGYAYLTGFGIEVPGFHLKIVDVSNPSAPVNVSDTPCQSDEHSFISVTSIDGYGRFLYQPMNDTLQIFNVTDPLHPSQKQDYLMDEPVLSFSTVAAYGYLSIGLTGVKVLDCSVPDRPLLLGFYDTPGNAKALDVEGDSIYVADSDAGLQILQLLKAPARPDRPEGPMQGDLKTSYLFSVTLPQTRQGDVLSVLWSWGDGTDSGWLTPYHSGEQVSASHSWNNNGSYDIKVKVKDSYDNESSWSPYLRFEVFPSLWWPMDHHDAGNAGYSTSSTPGKKILSWIHTFDDLHPSIFAEGITHPIVANGKVYTSLNYMSDYFADKAMVCLDAYTGKTLWNSWSVNSLTSAVVYDDKVYFGSSGNPNSGHVGILYCLDANTGRWLWTYNIDSFILFPPTVVNGKVYFSASYTGITPSEDTGLYCLNASTGEKIWYAFTVGFGSPTVVNNRLFLITSYGYQCEAVECRNPQTGALIWITPPIYTFTLHDNFCYSDPCYYNGMIFVTSPVYGGSVVTCFDAQGNDDGTTTQLWNATVWGNEWSDGVSTPSAAYGNVYVRDGNALCCLNASTGETVWELASEYPFVRDSCSIADGKLFTSTYYLFTDVNNFKTGLLCLDAYHGTAIWDYFLDNEGFSAPAIANGKVYCASVGSKIPHYLYCFGGENHAPDTPSKPFGTTAGIAGKSYGFSTKSADYDGNDIRFGWDWNGDLVVDDWTSFYPTQAGPVVADSSHAWDKPGYYEVRAKAKDSNGAEGAWSAPLIVLITPPPVEFSVEITSGIGDVSLTVSNIGTSDASDVSWNISFNGGFILKPKGGVGQGTINSVAAGSQETVNVQVFGFGKTMISATVTAANAQPVTTSVHAFMLGPFVFIKG